jgi:hypothetical protein
MWEGGLCYLIHSRVLVYPDSTEGGDFLTSRATVSPARTVFWVRWSLMKENCHVFMVVTTSDTKCHVSGVHD